MPILSFTRNSLQCILLKSATRLEKINNPKLLKTSPLIFTIMTSILDIVANYNPPTFVK